MKRYSVHIIADENCSRLADADPVGDFDLLEDAKTAAENAVSPFGAAIHDHATDEIDFGQGFGVAIETPGEA